MSTTDKDVRQLANKSKDADYWLGYMLRQKIERDKDYQRALDSALMAGEYFSGAVRRYHDERRPAASKPRKPAKKAISAKRTQKAA